MIVFPNVKINIGLNIVGKRPDGYHNLETVFYPVPMTEALEVVVPDYSLGASADACGYSFSQYGEHVAGDPASNLVIKALCLLKKDFDIPTVSVSLLKKLPMGAGLGGGSSDGAFMLLLLNQMFNLNLSQEQLVAYAAKLGADCAFFTVNRPVYATGIGEIMEPVEVALDGFTILIVKPNVFVSTKEAFSGIPVKPTATPVRDLVSRPVEEWRDCIFNDFEQTIFPLHPEIASVKAELYKADAAYAAMTGSGASVFGLFRGEPPLGHDKKFDGCFFFQSKLKPI